MGYFSEAFDNRFPILTAISHHVGKCEVRIYTRILQYNHWKDFSTVTSSIACNAIPLHQWPFLSICCSPVCWVRLTSIQDSAASDPLSMPIAPSSRCLPTNIHPYTVPQGIDGRWADRHAVNDVRLLLLWVRMIRECVFDWKIAFPCKNNRYVVKRHKNTKIDILERL